MSILKTTFFKFKYIFLKRYNLKESREQYQSNVSYLLKSEEKIIWI